MKAWALGDTSLSIRGSALELGRCRLQSEPCEGVLTLDVSASTFSLAPQVGLAASS